MSLRIAISVLAAAAAWVQPAGAQMPARPATIRELVNHAGAPPAAAPAPAVSAPRPAPVSPQPKPASAPAGALRRDPFDPLINKNPGAGGGPALPERLPPGKAGLMVGTVHVDGLVQGPNGMVAIVSNPQQRVYFLHEGDRIFDGRVTKITLEAVFFQQTGRDAFGNAVDHEVVKRLYPNPGEQR